MANQYGIYVVTLTRVTTERVVKMLKFGVNVSNLLNCTIEKWKQLILRHVINGTRVSHACNLLHGEYLQVDL